MKIFAALAIAILSLIALAILGDYLWRRWIAKMSAARKQLTPPHDRNH